MMGGPALQIAQRWDDYRTSCYACRTGSTRLIRRTGDLAYPSCSIYHH